MADRRNLRIAIPLALAVLILDQASKQIIVNLVMTPPRVIEVTGFFNLVLGYNTGVTFGLFGGSGAYQPYILAAIAIAVVTALMVWLRRADRWLVVVGIGMVSGGAIGNAIDRLTAPGVIDFLDFHAFGYHWYTFNIADCGIVIGVCLFLWDSLFAGAKSDTTDAQQRHLE